MYKVQMTFQKIICYFALIAAALLFIYSLGLVTDIYDILYKMIPDHTDLSYMYVEGADLYDNMQPFNKQLTKAGIVLILLALSLFLTNTHIRRRYYIGNYITTALVAVANIYYGSWAYKNIMSYKYFFLNNVNFEQLEKRYKRLKMEYNEADILNTFWLDISKYIYIILIVASVLLIVNVAVKVTLMIQEKKLINQGKDVAVNE